MAIAAGISGHVWSYEESAELGDAALTCPIEVY